MRDLTIIGHRDTHRSGYGKTEGSIACRFKWSVSVGVETEIPGQLPDSFMGALDMIFGALAINEGFVFTKTTREDTNEDHSTQAPGE